MKEGGLSLLELIITLAIASILTAISVPAFSKFAAQLRVQTAMQELGRAFALARSEAAKRGVRITLRNEADRWEDGWTMFIDANNNAVRDEGELILQQIKSTNVSLTMRGNTTVKSFVSYAPSGEAAHPSNAWQAGTITVCANTPNVKSYTLTLSKGGRVRQDPIIDNSLCSIPT